MCPRWEGLAQKAAQGADVDYLSRVSQRSPQPTTSFLEQGGVPQGYCGGVPAPSSDPEPSHQLLGSLQGQEGKYQKKVRRRSPTTFFTPRITRPQAYL